MLLIKLAVRQGAGTEFLTLLHLNSNLPLRNFQQTLFDPNLVEEHLTSQPLLAASLFSLLLLTIALLVFSCVFLSCRWRGECGAQKYQAYPTNSNNYALHLMLFFLSWLIVTSAATYFVLASVGFWGEKLDARRPIPTIVNSSIQLRHSRGISNVDGGRGVGELFADPNYHGDFENLTVSPIEDEMKNWTTKSLAVPATATAAASSLATRNLKRVIIRRTQPKPLHKFIEIPMRPPAEVIYTGSASDKFLSKKRPSTPTTTTTTTSSYSDSWEVEEEKEEEEEDEDLKSRITLSMFPKGSDEVEVAESVENEDQEDQEDQDLILTGNTMDVGKTTTVISTTVRSTTTTTMMITSSTPLTPTTKSSEVMWQRVETTPPSENATFNEILPKESIMNIPTHLGFRTLHPRFLIVICRLSFCLVAMLLAFVILPAFFFIIAGTGSYIGSDHPMNRSSLSNRIGQIVTVYASILLISSPLMLIFSIFALFYTHCHELLCAAIQLQHQQSDLKHFQSMTQKHLIEAYAINSNQCSKSLAPVQSLLLSSLLFSISVLPCVFGMFKLVKYFFRMNSEFYWNAADNYAGRRFSKQEIQRRYANVNSVGYSNEDFMNSGYASVYGQI